MSNDGEQPIRRDHWNLQLGLLIERGEQRHFPEVVKTLEDCGRNPSVTIREGNSRTLSVVSYDDTPRQAFVSAHQAASLVLSVYMPKTRIVEAHGYFVTAEPSTKSLPRISFTRILPDVEIEAILTRSEMT